METDGCSCGCGVACFLILASVGAAVAYLLFRWITGYGNTGDGNTGNGNATNYSSGFFCVGEPKVISFDVLTDMARDEFLSQFPEAYSLADLLASDAAISFEQFGRIPGITPEKLSALHEKHKAARKAASHAKHS